MMLFDYNILKFRVSQINYGQDIPKKDQPYFLIDTDIVGQLKIDPNIKIMLCSKEYYSAFEIDDYLLGHFEDLGSAEKKGLLSTEEVYNQFDWYVDIIWNNCEIQKYIEFQHEKEKDGEDIYENFKYIHDKLQNYK